MTTPRHVGAAAPRPVTPRCDNAPDQGCVIEGQGKADTGDYRSASTDDQESQNLATVRARAAQAGHQVLEMAGGGFLLVAVRGPNWQREAPDLAAAAMALRQITGGPR